MCRHAEDRKRLDRRGYLRCRECHRLNVRHLRLRDAQGRPRVERWFLNVATFKASVSDGRRGAVLELAGINSDSMGQYYRGLSLRDAERRARLSALCGTDVWTKEER